MAVNSAFRSRLLICGILILAHCTRMLTSPSNPLLKDVRRALARGGLTGQGYLVAESFHLLDEALRSDIDIKVVLTAESVEPAVRDRLRRLPAIRVAVVNDAVFRKLADT